MAHVIITGGSSGIGAALALACLRRGDDISLIARGTAQLQATRETVLASAGQAGAVFVMSGDVADARSIETAIAACEAALGPCDLLATSAGIVSPSRFEDQTINDFNAQILTNLIGTSNAARAVYHGMKNRRRGRILMIGSGAGLIGLYGYAAYCASKYGVLGFAEALRAEAKPLGIAVSICFPPDTQTPQLAAELKRRPMEAAAVMQSGGVWTAADVARVALSGLERGRFAIYPGAQMQLLGRFGSLALPILRSWSDRKIASARRRS